MFPRRRLHPRRQSVGVSKLELGPTDEGRAEAPGAVAAFILSRLGIARGRSERYCAGAAAAESGVFMESNRSDVVTQTGGYL
jgi:hypothetical protein